MYHHIKSNPCKFPNLFFEVSLWNGNNIINDFNGYCRCSNRRSWNLPRNIEQGGWANNVTTSQGAATGPWDPPWERAVSKGAPGNRTLGLHVHCLCTLELSLQHFTQFTKDPQFAPKDATKEMRSQLHPPSVPEQRVDVALLERLTKTTGCFRITVKSKTRRIGPLYH